MSSPAELLKLANELKAEQGASRRAAISRAYYAGFHALGEVVKPLLSESDLGQHGCPRHRSVVRALRNWKRSHPDSSLAVGFGDEAWTMSQLFIHCMEQREIADYVMGAAGEVSLAEALGLIGKVERMIKFAAKIQ
jgi:uncharacterized protein (UPF0332 family)